MYTKSKILELTKASKISAQLKKNNKKIILCHGTFDLLHTGHIKHIQRAKEQGDILFVSITADKYVLKGPGRPVFNQTLRSENIAALHSVDYVFVSNSETAILSIETIKPHLYVKGSDYKNLDSDVTGNIKKEKNHVEKYGGNIFFTNEITFSSSALINDHFSPFSDEVKDFLTFFKQKKSEDSIFKKIDSLKSKKVLIIGDAIIDKYAFVDPLGQTGKGNILSVNYLFSEQYAGGSIAVANHVANFADNVDLITGIGADDDFIPFIKKNLLKNVKAYFFKTNEKTLVKKRYVDQELNKFFEIYSSGKNYFNPKVENNIIKFIRSKIKAYDIVIVPDFGNGFITNNIANEIQKMDSFICVNTQLNSGNRGYHAINRYKKVNFISINEPEARLATHNKIDPIEVVAKLIKNKITRSEFISVTMGKKGVFSLTKRNNSFIVPALSVGVVDRIGAGDAYLSLTSLGLGSALGIEVSSFLGSVAAAIDVQIVGNKEYVSAYKVKKYISTLLK